MENKTQFQNRSQGFVGAVILEPGEKPKAVPVAAGDHIWLSDDEQRLTARAPRDSTDNPFENGSLVAVGAGDGPGDRWIPADGPRADTSQPETPEEEKAEETPAEAPSEPEQPSTQPKAPDVVEETANDPETGGAEGERAPAEEVATPEAQAKPRIPVGGGGR